MQSPWSRDHGDQSRALWYFSQFHYIWTFVPRNNKKCVSGAYDIQNVVVLVSRGLCLIAVNTHYTKFTLWTPKLQILAKGVFTWRRAIPLGRASTTRGLDFTSRLHGKKLALQPWLARLAESPRLTSFIFPRNPESDICVQVFILYPTHYKQTELVKWKVI